VPGDFVRAWPNAVRHAPKRDGSDSGAEPDPAQPGAAGAAAPGDTGGLSSNESGPATEPPGGSDGPAQPGRSSDDPAPPKEKRNRVFIVAIGLVLLVAVYAAIAAAIENSRYQPQPPADYNYANSTADNVFFVENQGTSDLNASMPADNIGTYPSSDATNAVDSYSNTVGM
jgi:hypothetical protein